MANKNNPDSHRESDTQGREIIINRVINAPRELVYEAFTDPAHLSKWWGPNGFTTRVHQMDVRPGGEWTLTMRGPLPNGTTRDFPNKMIYVEVVKPERLVFRYSDEAGYEPSTHVTTVTLEDIGNKTKLTLHMVFATIEEYNRIARDHGAVEGGKQTINRLEEHLSELMKGQELVITRDFNAPRELVFQALSEAKALEQWWGPKGSKIQVKQFQFCPGGIFHYSMEMGPMVMWGKFRYLEISAPERIVFISSFSDEAGNVTSNSFIPKFPLELMNIITLAEQEGKTTMTLRGGAINATDEEQLIYHGMLGNMQQGFAGTFEQLDEYLLQSKK